MQNRIRVQHIARLVRIDIQFVNDIKVIERRLQHEGWGVVQNILGRQSRRDEQFVNLPPGRRVANGHRGMEYQSFVFCLRTVIHYNAAQNGTVWNRHYLVLLGADACDKEGLLNHISYVIPNPDEISDLKGPHISEDRSRHPVRHR